MNKISVNTFKPNIVHALHNYLIGVRKRNLESPNIVGIVGIFFGPLTDFQIKTWRLIIMTTWSLCVIIIFFGSHTGSRICVIIYYTKNDLTVSMHKMLPISTSFISHTCLWLYFFSYPFPILVSRLYWP